MKEIAFAAMAAMCATRRLAAVPITPMLLHLSIGLEAPSLEGASFSGAAFGRWGTLADAGLSLCPYLVMIRTQNSPEEVTAELHEWTERDRQSVCPGQ
jgi:hypothetical protein